MPGEKRGRPVNLLDEDYLRERVGQGEGRKPQEEFRLIFRLFVQAVRPPDDKGGRFIQELRELKGREILAALIERHDAHALGQGGAQPLGLCIDSGNFIPLGHAPRIVGAGGLGPGWQPSAYRDDVEPWHGLWASRACAGRPSAGPASFSASGFASSRSCRPRSLPGYRSCAPW